jgi:hypothetical protein
MMIDFNGGMSRFVRELCQVIPEFNSIKSDRLLVSASFAQSKKTSGILAYVVPLKFRHGSPVEMRVRGDKEYHYAMLPLKNAAGEEILYILYFMLPRFLHLPFRDKVETVIHELYHIGPHFNGDLRRFRGRSELHGTLKSYDAKIRELAEQFFNLSHDKTTYAFLDAGARRLEREVEAHHVPEPKPKLLKVASTKQKSTNHLENRG